MNPESILLCSTEFSDSAIASRREFINKYSKGSPRRKYSNINGIYFDKSPTAIKPHNYRQIDIGMKLLYIYILYRI